MSRTNNRAAGVLVGARLLEPVQTATERHEPGTVVQWPQAQVEALVASASAEMLTAGELAAMSDAAEAEAKAQAAAKAGAQAEPLPLAQGSAGVSLL
jgi:hypothetical protein